ncbi:Glucose--fructose oxidoreductase precursor [Symmachiella macrocystis]|uniref:Glucose--fructose oxidoreductase n=1 Tax=Symmachiella macrocystis TaxID=2527985 RepID=A0A5C6BL03_9PLAN|nr:Gfo/Idh/MocA family oxidoreductase [Symmachiella macrocystis]TWU12778.1 Glucose--fructose oxidoreductase precursor [Symmachiella macrocystis]
MPIGFGLVGCGMIASFHARAIEDLRGAKIVALFDSFPASAERLAKSIPGVAVYSDYGEFLKHPGLDIVNVCTPSGAHMEVAVKAANAKKHVVVEKPLEITLKRCDKIIEACKKNKVKLATILPSRFSGANMALKKAIDSGRFGKLTLGDTYVKWWRSQEYYDSGGWRGTWALDGGGAYMNQAIHNVDLLYWLMGDVAEVSGITDRLAHERIEVEDTGVATVRFKNGALGVLEATTSAYPGLLKKTEIHGTTGTAIVEQDDILLWDFAKSTKKDDTIRETFAKKAGSTGGASDPSAISYAGHLAQLKDFIKAIKTNSTPVIDGREGRKSVEIILAIYKSSHTGRRVQLPLKSDPRLPR